MAKVAAKSPVKSKPLGKKADSSSSSSSSSSDSDDEPQQTKQVAATKASATKAPVSKLPVPTKATPSATPANNTNDKKRQREKDSSSSSSSSSSSDSEDEQPAKKKAAITTTQPIAPVPKQAYPTKAQKQPQQNDVSATPAKAQGNNQQLKHQQPEVISSQTNNKQYAANNNRINEVPAPAKVNDVHAKTQVTVRVNTNFETPCPHCGHKLEINMNIA